MYAGMLLISTFMACLMLAPGIQAKLADVSLPHLKLSFLLERIIVLIFF